MKSIQVKIISLFSILMFVILATVGVTNYIFFHKTISEDFETTSKSTVEMVDNTINSYFNDVEEALNNLSQDKTVMVSSFDTLTIKSLTETL